MSNSGASVGGEAGATATRTSVEVVQMREPTVRGIFKVVATVVVSALAIYVVYLLRTPLSYLFFAMFLAVIVSAPVNVLSERIPRGLAITLVYLLIILIPIGIGAILIPPAVRALSSLVSDLPGYVSQLNDTVQNNETLQNLNDNFDLTTKLQDLAENAAGRLDDAAGVIADIGAGLLGSLFAVFTVLVLSMFMVARGRVWTEAFLRTRPHHEAVVLRRALDRMAVAVAGYVGGALAQATIAGLAAFLMLSILGVPAPLALAVIIAVLDLIPLVGATIGAVLVGIVTLFSDFPTVTIIWAIFAIVYQQFENYVVQPRIQSRAVELDPFIIVVAALFGGALLGVIGALIAIPVAAALQIGIREFLEYRRTHLGTGDEGGDEKALEDGPEAALTGEGTATASGAGTKVIVTTESEPSAEPGAERADEGDEAEAGGRFARLRAALKRRLPRRAKR